MFNKRHKKVKIDYSVMIELLSIYDMSCPKMTVSYEYDDGFVSKRTIDSKTIEKAKNIIRNS